VELANAFYELGPRAPHDRALDRRRQRAAGLVMISLTEMSAGLSVAAD